MEDAPHFTRLITRAADGDTVAVEELYASAYQELRALAHARLGSHNRDALLDTTALVHESYLRLAGVEAGRIQDHVHFLRYASRAMRSVIVDCVRSRQARRRGGDIEHLPLTTRIAEQDPVAEDDILRVHEALEQLAKVDERLAQVVEMRYFGGMTEIEVATALALTERTVRRDWFKARALLSQLLEK